jgi:23S rRNA pseudouridine1911/1915/1917 synthase
MLRRFVAVLVGVAGASALGLSSRAFVLRAPGCCCCVPSSEKLTGSSGRSRRSLLREQRRVVRELADELGRLEVRGPQAVEFAEELFTHGVRAAADLSAVPSRILDAVGIVGQERTRLLAFSRLAAMESAAPVLRSASSAVNAAAARSGIADDDDEPAEGVRQETFLIEQVHDGARVDAALSALLPPLSRTYFGSLATDGLVQLNGQTAKKSARVAAGDQLTVRLRPERELTLAAEAIPLWPLYEDADCIVLDKQPGLVVHPAPGHWNGTLVNGLLFRMREQQAAGSAATPIGTLPTDLLPDVSGTGLRPGIVHRLDKQTSGALVAAKTARAQRALLAAFAERRVWKVYLAVCVGDPGARISVEVAVGRDSVDRLRMAVRSEEEGGRPAVSVVHRLATDGRISLVAVLIRTGRTHQVSCQPIPSPHPAGPSLEFRLQSPSCLSHSPFHLPHPAVLNDSPCHYAVSGLGVAVQISTRESGHCKNARACA